MEEPLVLDMIDSAVAPGVTAEKPPACEHDAAEEPVLAERVNRVLRARRVVLAGRREENAQRVAVQVDASDPDESHAFAFPRISRTRSCSQAASRPSSASGSGERTSRT